MPRRLLTNSLRTGTKTRPNELGKDLRLRLQAKQSQALGTDSKRWKS